ncbi:MAG: nucleoside phosphorylase [Bacteroidales bacterium]|nr:nucleoside phosphorylase [Bacteroidales bacterium]
MKRSHASSELIVHPDGSIFHLKLRPQDLADTVFLVGDPDRVSMFESLMDEILHESHNREFVSVTGRYRNHKITALSTGIGTDNIDIVMNELDALVNINLETRMDHTNHHKLRLIRIGTSGTIQESIAPGSWLLSRYVVGLDGLMPYYQDGRNLPGHEVSEHLISDMPWPEMLPLPYSVAPDESLTRLFDQRVIRGITLSAHGFYAPQGRFLRLQPAVPGFNEMVSRFRYGELSITNYEMETSALYGLSQLMGHQAITVCLIIANRFRGDFLEKYQEQMLKLIQYVLNVLFPVNEK